MGSYILKRIVMTLPVMAIVALFVFSLLYFAPGDPATLIAGEQASPEDVAKIRERLGLDEPYLVRFTAWIFDILRGELGTSIFTNLPVTQMIGERIGPTFSLAALSMVLTIVISVPLGVLAAWKRGTFLDRGVMGLTVLGFSVPSFVVGYIFAYIFAVQFKWLPIQGYRPLSDGLWPWLRHLLLPAFATATVFTALVARITRTAMLEVLQQDYIRNARAKGLAGSRILFVHALKNAAVPIVTVIGLGVALLISGLVVAETVFAIPGLGRLTADSILRRDYPVIQGIVLFFSFSYVLINMIIDITYTALDPRIRY